MEPKLIVHFIGKKARLTHHQLLPIYLRVTIDSERFEVATHQHTEPNNWLPSAGKVIGASDNAIRINMELDEIRKKVYDYKERIQKEGRELSIRTLREKWFGQDCDTRTLLEVVRLSLLDFVKQVGKGIYKKSTLTKYRKTFQKGKCRCCEKKLSIYDHWQLPAEYGSPVKLNDGLLRQKRLVEDLVSEATRKQITDKGGFVKKAFSPTLDLSSLDERIITVAKQETTKKEAKQDIYYQFDEYIKTKERKVSKANLAVYSNVKGHLQAFEKYRQERISFASFDFNFYHDFIDYLTFEHLHMRRQEVLTGLKLNTIGKTIKHLRGFIKDRVKRKIIAPIDLTDFKIPKKNATLFIYRTRK